MHTSFLFNTLWPLLIIQPGVHPMRAHQQLKRGMNPASSSGQNTSVSRSTFSSKWRALIKEYIAVDLTSLPGLETYAEELRSNWESTSSFTGQTSTETTIQSSNLSGSCDSHGYMIVTATSLVTLSALYTHLQILQTKCQEKGYTKTVSTLQSTKTQVSKVMYTVVKLTSTSDINTCAVAPSKSPYCGPVQSNMDGLKSNFASIELSITQERVDISAKIEIDSWTSHQDRPRTIGDVVEICREGHQIAQLGCQGVTNSIPAQGPTGIHFPFTSTSMRTSLKKFIPKRCQAIKSWVSNTTSTYPNDTISSPQGSGANSTNSTTNAVMQTPPPSIGGFSNGSPLPPKDQTSSACPRYNLKEFETVHIFLLSLGLILKAIIM